MDAGASLEFPFRGRGWLRRVLTGAALELVPLLLTAPLLLAAFLPGRRLGFHALWLLGCVAVVAILVRLVVIGYLRRVALAVLDGHDHDGLPRWDRFGEDLIEGARLAAVVVGLWLPAIGLVVGLSQLMAAAFGPSAAAIPVVLLGPLLALALLVLMPVTIMTVIGERSLVAAFDPARVWAALTSAPAAWLIAFAFAIAAEILAQIGIVLACVGIFATRFIAHAMVVHAFAQAYRDGRPRLAREAAVEGQGEVV